MDLHAENICDGGGVVKDDLALQWYVPLEVTTLRVLLPIALTVQMMATCLDIVRDDQISMYLSILGVASLTLLIVSLPDGTSNTRRDLSLLSSGLVLLIAMLHFAASYRSFVDIWTFSWLIVPAFLSLLWLSNPRVSEWTDLAMTPKMAAEGLVRNGVIRPRWLAVGTHVLLLHAVMLSVFPILWVIDTAISPGNALGGKFLDAVTVEHFAYILRGESFWLWLRNSAIVAIGTTILGLLLAIPAGYAFSRWKFRGRESGMFAFLLVQMFPGVIILVPYFLVMKSLGLLNTWYGLILAYSVTALPLCVWMLKGFFDTVPRELEEAALLDGCSQTQIFAKIVLPLSVPAIAVTALFSFLAAWNEFLLALTFNTSNEMTTLPVGLASMISATGQSWGDFAAASLLVSLPVVALFIIFQRFLIEGLSAGGVKG